MNEILYSKLRLHVPEALIGSNATVTDSKGFARTIEMTSSVVDIMLPGLEKYRVQAGVIDENINLGFGEIHCLDIFDQKQLAPLPVAMSNANSQSTSYTSPPIQRFFIKDNTIWVIGDEHNYKFRSTKWELDDEAFGGIHISLTGGGTYGLNDDSRKVFFTKNNILYHFTMSGIYKWEDAYNIWNKVSDVKLAGSSTHFLFIGYMSGDPIFMNISSSIASLQQYNTSTNEFEGIGFNYGYLGSGFLTQAFINGSYVYFGSIDGYYTVKKHYRYGSSNPEKFINYTSNYPSIRNQWCNFNTYLDGSYSIKCFSKSGNNLRIYTVTRQSSSAYSPTENYETTDVEIVGNYSTNTFSLLWNNGKKNVWLYFASDGKGILIRDGNSFTEVH